MVTKVVLKVAGLFKYIYKPLWKRIYISWVIVGNYNTLSTKSHFYETGNVITNFLGQPVSASQLFLEISQNSQENTCARVLCQWILRIYKNIFSYRTPLMAASVDCFNPTSINATIPLNKFPSSSTLRTPLIDTVQIFACTFHQKRSLFINWF